MAPCRTVLLENTAIPVLRMSEKFSREILRRNIAQICQIIGWNSIHSTPLDVMIDVLERYIRHLGSQATRYAEEFNRTEPNLHDLGLVFRDMHINLSELSDYVHNVPPVPTVIVEKFPKPKEPSLNFLKPGSQEVVTRPVHIHEYLPPIYPDKETLTVADVVEIQQNGVEGPGSPEISVTDSPDKNKDVFKRPGDPIQLLNSAKRPKIRPESEECHTREIKSVMMTMSGFLSPAREGKLPEPKAPFTASDKKLLEKHKTNHSVLPSEKKSKKTKLLNGKVVKSKRKDKHRSESKHKADNKMLAGKVKLLPRPPLIQNHVPSLPAPNLDTVRKIKSEPLDNDHFNIGHQPIIVKPSKNIPVPRLIPKHKSPIIPVIPQPIQIKQEIIDEDEKLTSQPDRSKLNIFKRISNKGKEDRNPEEKNRSPMVNNNNDVDDVPKNIDLTANEVISLDDESLDYKQLPLTEFEPIENKPIEPLPPFPMFPFTKPKKDKKHKEKKDKAALKAAKMNEKLLKKMSSEQMKKPREKKIPKPRKTPKNDLKGVTIPMPAFPMLPFPQPGLIPNPGLIPGGEFFANLAHNPLMRDFSHPNLLANPFAMAPQMPSTSHTMPNPLSVPSQSNKQKHFNPFLGRPDLEVFPIQNYDNRNALPSAATKEKHRSPNLPNIIQKQKKHKERTPKLKTSEKMDLIQPDVIINESAPQIKQEPLSETTPPIQSLHVEPSPIEEPFPEKLEKKKEKLHKKEKREKDAMKHKKKKEKKDKHKEKLLENINVESPTVVKEKMKKEKKEKKREKELVSNEGFVPKLTLKLGSSSPMPPSSPDTYKLNIKPLVKKEDEKNIEEPVLPEGVKSPELAQISPLVTRPPKHKHSKHSDQIEVKQEDSSSPPRKHKDKSKFKRLLIKPISKKGQLVEDETISLANEVVAPPVQAPPPPAPLQAPPVPIDKTRAFYIDDAGNKVWVCPACAKQDNGTPMIGCDGCDCWYHWICVGITQEPGAQEDWFCKACIAKRTAMVSALSGMTSGIKKRGRKPKDRV